MTRPCRTCGSCSPGPVGLYTCNARRLRDPDGALTAMPTRTIAGPSAFAWEATDAERAATLITRSMSPGPVEGYIVDRASGDRRPFVYNETPCPAWSPR